MQLIKYGVVRLSALQRDLLHWSTLYCAGRLHKPVATLREHPAVAAAQAENLLCALRCALLLLPDRFGTMVSERGWDAAGLKRWGIVPLPQVAPGMIAAVYGCTPTASAKQPCPCNIEAGPAALCVRHQL